MITFNQLILLIILKIQMGIIWETNVLALSMNRQLSWRYFRSVVGMVFNLRELGGAN